MIVARLVGGPQDGRVARVSPAGPAVVILEHPRWPRLGEDPGREARWNAGREWYELVPSEPAPPG